MNTDFRMNAVLGSAIAIATGVLLIAPSHAQISSQGVRDRYERQTKGSSIDDYVRKLESDDPAKRLEGVKLLGESNDEKAVEYLVQALGDTDMRIKAKAIDGLGDMRATEATPVLIQQLFLRGNQPEVKRRILAALGKIGDARATASILEFAQRDLDADTQGTVIFALGELGAIEGTGWLENIRDHSEDPNQRRLARQALVKVQHHQSLRANQAERPQETFLRRDQPPPRR